MSQRPPHGWPSYCKTTIPESIDVLEQTVDRLVSSRPAERAPPTFRPWPCTQRRVSGEGPPDDALRLVPGKPTIVHRVLKVSSPSTPVAKAWMDKAWDMAKTRESCITVMHHFDTPRYPCFDVLLAAASSANRLLGTEKRGLKIA